MDSNVNNLCPFCDYIVRFCDKHVSRKLFNIQALRNAQTDL